MLSYGFRSLKTAVLAYVLAQQTTQDLVITGAIVAASLAYWWFHLRPRQSTRWVISVPEEELGLDTA